MHPAIIFLQRGYLAVSVKYQRGNFTTVKRTINIGSEWEKPGISGAMRAKVNNEMMTQFDLTGEPRNNI